MKIPKCAECGDVEIEQTIKKVWNMEEERWEETKGEAIYDCPDCGECDLEWEETPTPV